MKLRLAPVVLALLLALAGADSATAASTGPEVTASAKKCKRPKARHNGRCVRRCPAGYVKRANKRWGRKCVRRTGNQNPGPQPLFAKPSGELTGQDAFNHFSQVLPQLALHRLPSRLAELCGRGALRPLLEWRVGLPPLHAQLGL